MQKFLQFLQYHNSVPIAISLLLLGAGGAFAATDPQAVYSQQQTVVSVDNSYLLHLNLSTYTPSVVITGVTQDSNNYYVAYSLQTVDLQNNVWQPVTKPETMEISIADLGPYRDLGVYVTQQLTNVVDRELQRLQETQTEEAATPSQEQVVTQYGGLVGKFLNPKTDTLPGYTPVITTPPPSIAGASSSSSVAATTEGAQPPPLGPLPQSGSQPQHPQQTQPPAQSQPQAPTSALATIQVLGNNPAMVPLRSSYVDLGAAITGPTTADLGLGINLYLDGTQVQQNLTLDTSVVGTHTVEYRVTNAAGTAVADRTVEVYDPNAQATSTSSASSGPSSGDDTGATTSSDDTDNSGASAPSDGGSSGSSAAASGSSSDGSSPTQPDMSDTGDSTTTSQ